MYKAFERFYDVASESTWGTPHDIIKTFNNSDLVTCKKQKTTRIVFNIGHNKYRLITGYFFTDLECILYIKFIGTHKEYDLIDVCEVDLFKKK